MRAWSLHSRWWLRIYLETSLSGIWWWRGSDRMYIFTSVARLWISTRNSKTFHLPNILKGVPTFFRCLLVGVNTVSAIQIHGIAPVWKPCHAFAIPLPPVFDTFYWLHMVNLCACLMGLYAEWFICCCHWLGYEIQCAVLNSQQHILKCPTERVYMVDLVLGIVTANSPSD